MWERHQREPQSPAAVSNLNTEETRTTRKRYEELHMNAYLNDIMINDGLKKIVKTKTH